MLHYLIRHPGLMNVIACHFFAVTMYSLKIYIYGEFWVKRNTPMGNDDNVNEKYEVAIIQTRVAIL